MITKEDFVNEIFVTAIHIAMYSLPLKDILVNIGKDENKRQAAIRHLKDMCSNINIFLNGLRTENDFERYSKDYDINNCRWFTFLKEQGIATDPEKMKEYQNICRRFVSLLEDRNIL